MRHSATICTRVNNFLGNLTRKLSSCYMEWHKSFSKLSLWHLQTVWKNSKGQSLTIGNIHLMVYSVVGHPQMRAQVPTLAISTCAREKKLATQRSYAVIFIYPHAPFWRDKLSGHFASTWKQLGCFIGLSMMRVKILAVWISDFRHPCYSTCKLGFAAAWCEHVWELTTAKSIVIDFRWRSITFYRGSHRRTRIGSAWFYIR